MRVLGMLLLVVLVMAWLCGSLAGNRRATGSIKGMKPADSRRRVGSSHAPGRRLVCV